jgi:hypothetical protein
MSGQDNYQFFSGNGHEKTNLAGQCPMTGTKLQAWECIRKHMLDYWYVRVILLKSEVRLRILKCEKESIYPIKVWITIYISFAANVV